MKFFYYLIFFLTFISCSSDKNKDQFIDLDAFISRGKKINFSESEKNFFKKDIIKINSIKSDQNIKNKLLNWSQNLYDSQNFIRNGSVDLNKIKKKISIKIEKAIYVNNLIIAVDSNRNLLLFDENLKIIKKKKIYKKKFYNNYELKFSLAFLNDNIILSDNAGNIQAFDIKSLDRKWINYLSSPFQSEIKIYKNNIYVINSNSKIFSIKSSNGDINWSYETSSEIIKGDKSYQIAISNDKIIFLNNSAEIYCIDIKNKKILWSFIIDKYVFKNNPIILQSSSFLVNNDILYFSTNFGKMISVNINNGQILWSSDIIVTSKIYSFNKKLFFINSNNFMIINQYDGKILYNKNFSYLFSKNNSKKYFLKDLYFGDKYLYLFSNNGHVVQILKNNFRDIKVKKIFSSFDDYIFFKNNVLFYNKNSLILF